MGFPESIRRMLDYYYETEQLYSEIIRLVPLDNAPETHSPRLYDILQSSCSQVENLMRLICGELKLEPRSRNFPSYFNEVNKTGVLELQVVASVIDNIIYKPFEEEISNEPPLWWTAYNKTKHKLPLGFNSGNLINTSNALSAVYALHCIAAYVRRCESTNYDVMNDREWHIEESLPSAALRARPQADHIDSDMRPRSDLFYCLSHFRPLTGGI